MGETVTLPSTEGEPWLTGYRTGSVMDLACRRFLEVKERKPNLDEYGNLNWINGYAKCLLDQKQGGVPESPSGASDELAFQVLEMYGVPRTRAKTVHNGIMVLAERIRKSEPSPEPSEIPAVLFDGFAVFKALDDKARKRTGTENVSDVLDAVVRLLRASPGEPPGEAPFDALENFATWCLGASPEAEGMVEHIIENARAALAHAAEIKAGVRKFVRGTDGNPYRCDNCGELPARHDTANGWTCPPGTKEVAR